MKENIVGDSVKENQGKFVSRILSPSVWWLCLAVCMAACTATNDVSKRGQPNRWSKLRVLAGKRAARAYNHPDVKPYRARGDCFPNCPLVDIWQYQYKAPDGTVITDTKPIATRRSFWKAKHEARIISFTLYGNKKVYLDGILDYLKSFTYVKKNNSELLKELGVPINRPWGYETFTVRVYVAKRNPMRLERLGPLGNATEEKFIRRLLELGAEIAFVDNGLPKVGRDATYWRFWVAAEPMPPGQRIRYLLRDVDWKLTAGEAFAVGEWIQSGLRYHRMHLMPTCMTPLVASIWGGVHEGHGPLADMAARVAFYPDRSGYAEEEVFLRKLVWPVMKASGSVLTHLGARSLLHRMATPYYCSCEEPTRVFCQEVIDRGRQTGVVPPEVVNRCRDETLPAGITFPVFKLAYNVRLSEIIRKVPEAFTFAQVRKDPEGNARITKAIRALSWDFGGSSQSERPARVAEGME